MCRTLFLIAVLSLGSVFSRAFAEVTLVDDGVARVAIYVAPETMLPDVPFAKDASFELKQKETLRRRLRDSVYDLSQTLEKISGAPIAIHQRQPAVSDTGVPILIGNYAKARFGGVQTKSTQGQGWRVTVQPEAIGLQGETAEGASYAIYEVLDRLGCRWYLPGEMGEVLPAKRDTVTLKEDDRAEAPHTEVRTIWYADDAFRRRNRLGGTPIRCDHVLEKYVTEEQREKHPEWRGIVGGKPHHTRLKWSNPKVSEAIADEVIARLDKQYMPSISLAPGDGSAFDESDDVAMDAGDWDAASGTTSITDRYIAFCNQIAERVLKQYPEMRFGFLAYVQYTRPPVREKPHRSLVPEIAPINYCRAHSFGDGDRCPSRMELKEIIEGWGKVSPEVIYYPYMFHLAEVTAPFPMIRQLSQEVPFAYANHVIYWQPETLPNFEQVLPGMWLTLRLAWDKTLKPEEVLAEFYTGFYGAAAQPMKAYWELMDRAWNEPLLHAGSFWSYSRRFTPELMKEARTFMDEAKSLAATPMEYRRVEMQDRALRQLERYMTMRTDLNEGRLARLDLQAAEWYGTQMGLANEYEENYAFSKVMWTRHTVGGEYFHNFQEATLRDAARMAKDYTKVSAPLRKWKYSFIPMPASQLASAAPEFDGIVEGEKLGWEKPDFKDSDWKETDSALDTWSDLGISNTNGTMWYRATISTVGLKADRKTYLWISATDGRAKVFINGKPAPFINAKGETLTEASGYCEPFTFEITDLIKAGKPISLAIAGARFPYLNELGTGGLLGPAYLFQEK